MEQSNHGNAVEAVRQRQAKSEQQQTAQRKSLHSRVDDEVEDVITTLQNAAASALTRLAPEYRGGTILSPTAGRDLVVWLLPNGWPMRAQKGVEYYLASDGNVWQYDQAHRNNVHSGWTVISATVIRRDVSNVIYDEPSYSRWLDLKILYTDIAESCDWIAHTQPHIQYSKSWRK